MDPDVARHLFEQGGLLLILDLPRQCEFGIDMYTWKIGPKFQGIKMIPPGIHFVYYSVQDNVSNDYACRQGFFVEFNKTIQNQMLKVYRWSKEECYLVHVDLSNDDYERYRSNRYQMDDLLGQYPLDTYRQWLSLTNQLKYEWITQLQPINGHICSATVYNPTIIEPQPKAMDINSDLGNTRSSSISTWSDNMQIPKNLLEAESRLPTMTPMKEYEFRFTILNKQQPEQFENLSGRYLTKLKLDRTNELEIIIHDRYSSNVNGLLCELQFSFIIFLLGHVYDGFEQWKLILKLICYCQKAFITYPKFYCDFLQLFYFQLKEFSTENYNEHFFIDIDQNDNYIYKALENFFANIYSYNETDEENNIEQDKSDSKNYFFIMFLLPTILIISSLLLSVLSTAIFQLNPGCDLIQCANSSTGPSLFYSANNVSDHTYHVFYSSFDVLTVSIVETEIGVTPHINWEQMFAGNYTNAIVFQETPTNSYSIVLRRIMEFDDYKDTGKISETTLFSYWLNTADKYNISYSGSTSAFRIPIDEINGTLNVEIVYEGIKMRDKKFPKLSTTPTSYFLNIELKAAKLNSSRSRFAIELLTTGFSDHEPKISSSRYIDDQYTPGIFSVWQLKTPSGSLYPAHLIWKPAVYRSAGRSIEDNTLMTIYGLKNVSIDKTIDRGLIDALYRIKYPYAFNISFGRSKDGFFKKTNYTFIQITAGLGEPVLDSTKLFVTLAVTIGLGLPALVALMAIIIAVRRRYTRRAASTYEPISD
ncbi:unnamed protein product [Didymodactylos carnosus]|uniref:Protein AAR2 homolog n=1 Tax=Didymodactylos carnosus TaxID=1234261 RepID=A0A813QFS5_9BILA|nr:unnamed protein product [Didymodactylos carnosus]CAF0766795.1 unnamed protein product [Didymodactylos carnosus]CAF3504863.1 unnamed protein product [Didymodactylos carnosus]CAF3548363.1 unnamed protein product [Didymodactylos carnosus]